MSTLILASASPRRAELLSRITVDFTVLPTTIDETIPETISPEKSAEYLAIKKAKEGAKNSPHNIIIAADTTVLLGKKRFGKPKDTGDAIAMLSELSGRVHRVITGVAIAKNARLASFSSVSSVTFYPLTDTEIADYVATGEPLDKAGAYGIQGKGALFVREIHGDFFGIMGLPIAELSRQLKAF